MSPGVGIAMRTALETGMYLSLSAAALPLAWASVHRLLYFRHHPEMLEVRDAALEVGVLVAFSSFVRIAFWAACLLAVYFLARGPGTARLSIGVLAATHLSVFVFAPELAFASWGRLYWDAAVSVTLCAVPLLCSALRLTLTRTGP